MVTQEIDFPKIIPIFDKILEKGLCQGAGSPNGQMCIEQAVCCSLGLKISDRPACVTAEVINFKIRLNDCHWSSPNARAKGLRNLGIAQIGSLGVISHYAFNGRLQEKFIKILIPNLIRRFFNDQQSCLDVATKCELFPTVDSCSEAYRIIDGYALNNSVEVSIIIHNVLKIYPCNLTERLFKIFSSLDNPLTNVGCSNDENLLLMAKIGLEILQELRSPGCAWI